ncbi:MAG: tRNA (guanosine(37)-N1)-methyltransferase TrmD [Proteobacteria bacterium]|nr:tRNA (guanosine(37)-N1)-methyltransferase TrmD [Pseudomonadota bacterium]
MLNLQVFTLFPELFPGPLGVSITGSALVKKLWSLQTIDIRQYATDFRKTVDDTVYGGGSGMLIKPDVVYSAISQNIKPNTKLIYLSPKGKVFCQEMAYQLACENDIAVLCGRYEGVDQRVLDALNFEEVSIGDYVLSGGEMACYVFVDAILRCLPQVLGKSQSLLEESFGNNQADDNYKYLLEYPQYTKPAVWQNMAVPKVLLSGHHQKIKEWQQQQAENITQKNRPDLYNLYLQNKK